MITSHRERLIAHRAKMLRKQRALGTPRSWKPFVLRLWGNNFLQVAPVHFDPASRDNRVQRAERALQRAAGV